MPKREAASKQKSKTTVSVKYEVLFGPKDESGRKKAVFWNQDDAAEFFQAKEKAGMHVDAYEIEETVTRKTKKLSV